MGSAAHRASDDSRYAAARALLSTIEGSARTYPNPDIPAIVSAIDSALDDLRDREATLLFLAAYLSRCLTGSVPDYTIFEP